MYEPSTHHRYAINRFTWLDPFEPHRWYRGGWLQTISIKTLRPALSVQDWDGAVTFEVVDDETPSDRMRGFYLPPRAEQTESLPARPVVILFHGMGGHAESGYMRSIAETLLGDGYPVVLWNNRGAGESASNCSQFHHPGRIQDVRCLIDYLHAERPEWISDGLAAIAFSLGANVLLRYLADSGDESRLNSCVTISAPLDMKLTSKNLRRGWNKLFDAYLLKRQQEELLRENADLSEKERETICNASCVWDLDDRFTGPRFGYSGAEEYYQSTSAIHVLAKIRVPTLMLHAADDPVVVPEVFDAHEWNCEGPLFPALAQSGGHTGFLDRDGKRWHERASAGFFSSMNG